MEINELFEKAKSKKNLQALKNLKDAALHLQEYEIASKIKKEIEHFSLPEYLIMEKRNNDEYTNTVFSTHLEISGDFIGLINTGKIVRLDKIEIEEILEIMNKKVRQR